MGDRPDQRYGILKQGYAPTVGKRDIYKKGSHTHLYDCLILTKLMLFGLKKTFIIYYRLISTKPFLGD